MTVYSEYIRYKLADLHVAAMLAEAASDYALASEYIAAYELVRGALDWTGQLAGVYRLMCWREGEPIKVNGVTFTYDGEYWISDSKIERGLRKGEPAVRLNSVFMLQWMSVNKLIPIIQNSRTEIKEEK